MPVWAQVTGADVMIRALAHNKIWNYPAVRRSKYMDCLKLMEQAIGENK